MIVTYLLLILVAAIIVFAIIARPASPKRPVKRGGTRNRVGTLDRNLVAQRWATVKQMAASDGGNGLRSAVSEADKLLDYTMKHSGFSGETMGERLKLNGKRFSNIDGVWQAHKLRNALAHEVGFDIVPSQVNDALNQFERALKDLGAL